MCLTWASLPRPSTHSTTQLPQALHRLACRRPLQDTLRTNPLLLAALCARLVRLWQDLQQQQEQPDGNDEPRHQDSSLPAGYQRGDMQWAGGEVEGEGEGEATGEAGLQEAAGQVRRVLARVGPMLAGALPQMSVGQLASTVWAVGEWRKAWECGWDGGRYGVRCVWGEVPARQVRVLRKQGGRWAGGLRNAGV